ncbi:MAG TPA: GatB/YqeY domain-containing protein [Vicinamibacterales bacterium]|nr:GatB/YqeY domain-containing protein [Vicinamibacterales bacterium]
MTIIERIGGDMAAAMRARDQARLAPLRMAKAALMNKEVEKGRGLEEGEAQQVMASLIKQRRDSIDQFRKGGREDLASKEAAEIAVLEAYLPPPVDIADLEAAVDAAIAETAATSPKDLGRVMKAVMGRLAGRAVDGKRVNELVRERLGA